jgi:hypothetical protein
MAKAMILALLSFGYDGHEQPCKCDKSVFSNLKASVMVVK